MKIRLAITFLALAISAPAQIYKFSVIHQFHDAPDGNKPIGQIVVDPSGNAYGTTEGGGRAGLGVVWKLSGTKETIRQFNGKNGHDSESGLNGSSIYYGTTQEGGGDHNYGTVFQVANDEISVVHSFTGGLDGRNPTEGIALDGAGNLYGVSNSEDGGYGGGIFEISQGVFTIIYAAGGGPIAVDLVGDVFFLEDTQDGSTALAELVSGGAELLYTFPSGAGPVDLAVSPDGSTVTGITEYGGQGYGSIWQWTETGGEVDLYDFPESAIGLQNPNSPVTFDGLGNAFGTIEMAGGPHKEFGVAYEVNLGTTNPPVVLHQFTGLNDGYYPLGPLTIDASGNLYGAANEGGKYQRGTVFKLTKK
jgi:hypothetical protein